MNKPIIFSGQSCGKTTELIRLSNKHWYYILVANQEQASNVARMAEIMKLDIPYPITFSELPLKPGQKINGILIDEVEQLLNTFIHKPIKAFTTSVDVVNLFVNGKLNSDKQESEIKGLKAELAYVNKIAKSGLEKNDIMALERIIIETNRRAQ